MFRKARRSALIHELQMEVAAHHHRLDRATGGMSPAFVPTSGEHVRIDEEHRHLDSLRLGTFELGVVWHVKHPRGGSLSIKQRRSLLTEAIDDVAELELQYADVPEKQAMWRTLYDYLIAKRSCSCVEAGQEHTWQYSTIGQDFGYAMRACSPQHH